VVVIEHNLDVVKSADWIIDLGPEGGDLGGRVVGAGTPETIARIPDSNTGEYVARALTGEAPASNLVSGPPQKSVSRRRG
jgi:excinuclease ABC subunit A